LGAPVVGGKFSESIASVAVWKKEAHLADFTRLRRAFVPGEIDVADCAFQPTTGHISSAVSSRARWCDLPSIRAGPKDNVFGTRGDPPHPISSLPRI
jgi:hypothetical protein